jgi:hypothetical protein
MTATNVPDQPGGPKPERAGGKRSRSGPRPPRRANREGSIFPYRGRYAAYVWVTTPTGERKRRWVYGKTRDETHDKWVKLQAQAAAGPVPTTTPTVAEYLNYWLAEVIKPNREPSTYSQYELMARLHHPCPGWRALGPADGPSGADLAESASGHLPMLCARQGRAASG